MRFSERIGYRQLKTAIQVDSMDGALRSGLWNVFQQFFVQTLSEAVKEHRNARTEMRETWDEFFKRPTDEAPQYIWEAIRSLKPMFLNDNYVDIYDLVDFCVQRFSQFHSGLEAEFNKVLEREVSGFRFVGGLLSPITDEYELETIEEGLAVGGRFSGAASHLQTALKLLSDRSEPDYRNSVKESISAVESAAKVLTGKPKATLGDLLPVLEQSGHIHPAQKDAFSKLYGYASDEGGIRHAMLDKTQVDFPDAKYMLAVCAAFIVYLELVSK